MHLFIVCLRVASCFSTLSKQNLCVSSGDWGGIAWVTNKTERPVAYFSLTVCKCAVCVLGPLLVCFCQWRCTFSSSYAKDGSGTDGQSPLMVSVAAFQPREKGSKWRVCWWKSSWALCEIWHIRTQQLLNTRLTLAITEPTVTFKQKTPSIAWTHRQTSVRTHWKTLQTDANLHGVYPYPSLLEGSPPIFSLCRSTEHQAIKHFKTQTEHCQLS